jgi:hypothetical protein
MITEDIKQQLVSNAVKAILNSNGTLLYSDKKLVRYGEVDANEITLATFCLVDSVIAHNIPIWPNGIRTLRDYSLSWRGADVFGQTNIDENHFIWISQTEEGFSKYQKSGDIKIGRLAFRDNTHTTFASGSGGWLCDFIDLDYGYLIEAKYNYFNGSPSGLHDATHLLDYGDSDAKLYKTVRVGRKNIVPKGSVPLAIFEEIIKPRQHLNYVPGLSNEYMRLISSGELIPVVEACLEKEGFKWNP